MPTSQLCIDHNHLDPWFYAGVMDSKSLEQLVVDLDASRELVPEKVGGGGDGSQTATEQKGIATTSVGFKMLQHQATAGRKHACTVQCSQARELVMVCINASAAMQMEWTLTK
eukprot:800368-Pelagomonas_calceolata.AAC.1